MMQMKCKHLKCEINHSHRPEDFEKKIAGLAVPPNFPNRTSKDCLMHISTVQLSIR